MSKGKAVSRGQALQVSARVATQVNWDQLDGDHLQREIIDLSPEEFGRRVTVFLKNGAKVFIVESNIVPIDRSKPFNPTEFIGKNWIIAEQDKRSLSLTEVDLTEIRFETCLKKDEIWIKGKEKLKRLKNMDCIRLDAKILQTLWENKHLIPRIWKEEIDGRTRLIFFDGTILRGSRSYRYVLFLSWRNGEWHWSYAWLDNDCRANFQSAVLASS